MTEHLTLRVPEGTQERLRRLAGRAGTAPRSLAQRYVEEGVRRDEHPLVTFVDRPSGRRARLIGTRLDVWEAIEVLRANDGDVETTAGALEQPRHVIEAALAYYGAVPDEIDAEIASNEWEIERARAALAAGRAALAPRPPRS